MKTKLLVLLLFSAKFLFGQTLSKGDILLEGGLSYSSIETGTKTFNIRPTVYYLLNEKFALGVGLRYGISKISEQSLSGGVPKTINWGATLFARHYFWELGSRFKTFGQMDLGYSNQDLRYYGQQADNTYPINTFSINAGLGANYFLTNKIALGYQISNILSFSNTRSNLDITRNSFSANLNQFGNLGSLSFVFKL